MKLPARIGVWLLPLMLTGCIHRSHPAQNAPLAPPAAEPQQKLPAPEPTKAVPEPAPAVEPAKPAESTGSTTPATPSTSGAPKPPVHRTPKKPVPPQQHQQVASNSSGGVSAIGQLSSGDPVDSRSQTEDSLASTERGLKSLTRPLNDQEQRTVAHIREFVKQARQALASGDVDGAHTLASKARVLLNELSR